MEKYQMNEWASAKREKNLSTNINYENVVEKQQTRKNTKAIANCKENTFVLWQTNENN